MFRRPLDPALVPYTTLFRSLTGTAGEGSDYPTITTHSVTIAAGSTSATVSIDPTTNGRAQGCAPVASTLRLRTSARTGTTACDAINGSPTGRITDDAAITAA